MRDDMMDNRERMREWIHLWALFGERGIPTFCLN